MIETQSQLSRPDGGDGVVTTTKGEWPDDVSDIGGRIADRPSYWCTW